MTDQDWKSAVLRKKTTKSSVVTPIANVLGTASAAIAGTMIIDENTIVVPKMIDTTFGQQIQKCRVDKGLTQKQLAQNLSIPVAIINQYERGEGTHVGQYVAKIKKYFNIIKNA